MLLKETYFTNENIQRKATEMVKFVERYCAAKCSPSMQFKETALLILDMQRFFLKPDSHAFVPSAPSLLPGLTQAILFCKRQGMPIYFTQHANQGNNAGMMSLWWKDLLHRSHPGFPLIEELDTLGSERIEKCQYDAFYKTDLEKRLQHRNIRTLIVTGVMTNLCCETTARSAFVRGFRVFFPADGSATMNEQLHLSSLLNLGHGFAHIGLLEQFIA